MNFSELFQQYMIDPLANNEFMQAGFAVMIFSAFLFQIRSLPRRIYNWIRIYSTKSISVREDSPIFEQVLRHVTENISFMSSPRHSQLKVDFSDVNKLRRDADVSSFICKIEGAMCLASLDVDDSRNGGNDNEKFSMMKKTWIIRITILGSDRTVNKIVRKFEGFLAEKKEKKPYITVNFDSWGGSSIRKMRRTSDSLCFDDGVYSRIKESCETFVSLKEEHSLKGFPWSFGILMHGNPGTGKSSIIHVLASEMDRSIAYINLADMKKDEDLQDRLSRNLGDSIIVFEDIDCLFNDRENTTDGVTFSGLLNTLDGLCGGDDGRIIIMTTNHLDKLDPALIRPGRVDLLMEIPDKPSIKMFVEYLERVYHNQIPGVDGLANRIYNECSSTAELIQKIREETNWKEYDKNIISKIQTLECDDPNIRTPPPLRSK